MNNSIVVQNIKCGGCANSIKKKLQQISGVSTVEVNVVEGKVSWESSEDRVGEAIRETLSSMGYPEGDSSLIQTAKSFVSCAIGRFDKGE